MKVLQGKGQEGSRLGQTDSERDHYHSGRKRPGKVSDCKKEQKGETSQLPFSRNERMQMEVVTSSFTKPKRSETLRMRFSEKPKIQAGINQDLNISSEVADNHIAILNR